jgi:hypothetical protein
MLPAVLEDAVVDQVELHASSVPVDHKRHVICLHDLVIPDAWLKWMAIRIILDEEVRMFYWNPRMCHGDRVQRTIIVLPIFIPTTTSIVRFH